jgi:diadenosine tetraphosphatase ApaH/serine/threonine PP2A family protein phosphatase
VGQPRDYDNRACCGLYDTETRRFEYVRVAYDIEAAARKIYDANVAVAFGKRLFLGV